MLNKPIVTGILSDKEARVRDKQKKWNKTAYEANKEKLLSIKILSGGCAYCGWNIHPEIMHFHHRNPLEKEGMINRFLKSKDFTKVQKEIDKCDLICPNCHVYRHYRESFKKMNYANK
jgi:5-methylcytosine-specific restriction endonuclease McrA